MALLKSLVLILSAVASVSALATPHVARNSFHHRALAHRAPVAVPAPLNVPVAPLRKRANGKRCRQRPASSSAVAAPATTTPVANAAPEPTVEKPTTTTAAQEKPTTTDTPATTPEPSPTPKPSPTTTKAVETPKPATTQANNSNLPSFMVGTQTGQGTFYGTGLGACGIVNTDADFIAAVSHLLFDSFPNYKGGNPNNNPICGRKVQATFQGKSVTVAITDRCEACALTDLDFSPTAFNQIADPALGRISGMKWVWL